MKTIALTLLLAIITLSTFANDMHLKNKCEKLKPIELSASNKIVEIEPNILRCTLTGTAWAQTGESECPDGSSVSIVFSGIAWELVCDGSTFGFPIYAVFCKDVESGDGCN